MNARKIVLQWFILVFSLLMGVNSVATSTTEVKVGVILPHQEKKVVEENISTVIAKLNEKCLSQFTFAANNKWYYYNCDDATNHATGAAKQVEVLFNEGCFHQIKDSLPTNQISPYPVSSYTGTAEIKKHLEQFCGEEPESVLQEYLVNVPFILLHTEIPIDEKGNYQPNTFAGKVVAKLAQDDIIVENPKDNNGRYKDKTCKKRIQFKAQEQLVWYDWSQTRDWFCVTVKQSKEQSNQNKIGWVHRLSLLVRKTTD